MPAEPFRQVHLVIYPGFKSMEAVGPINVFSYANRYLARHGGPRGYRIDLVAPRPGPVPSDMGLSLTASGALPEGRLSTVMVTGAVDIEDSLRHQDDLVAWCRRRARDAERFAALCSGSFFLAAAGLLEERRAATHWSVAATLQHRFPKIKVDADAIFVQDGNLWTSAGVTAAIDLALAFVEQDFGRNLALEVARDLVVYLKRPGGQSQYSAALSGQTAALPGIRDVQGWIIENLDKPLRVPDMARQAGMSPRNFTRRFVAALGVSPASFLEQMRCERARGLLIDSDLPLKMVAHRAGFRSDEQMRRSFVRRLSLSPRAYRERFRTSGRGCPLSGG